MDHLKHVSAVVVFLSTTTPCQRSVMLHVTLGVYDTFFMLHVTLGFYFSFGKIKQFCQFSC